MEEEMRSLFVLLVFLVLLSTPAEAGILVIGPEDIPLWSGGADQDYLDMVFTMSGANTIEPCLNCGGGGWRHTPTPDKNFHPFWDGSEFYNGGNIGHLVQTIWPKSEYEYWGNQYGGAAPFLLEVDRYNGDEITVTMINESSAWAGLNTLWWFDPATPSGLNPVFTTVDTVGTTKIFRPSDIFGLALISGSGDTYASGGVGYSQFAVFHEVPEPSTIGLVGAGLLAGTIISRRRRQRKNDPKTARRFVL